MKRVARGFFMGLVWGSIASALALAVLSQVAPLGGTPIAVAVPATPAAPAPIAETVTPDPVTPEPPVTATVKPTVPAPAAPVAKVIAEPAAPEPTAPVAAPPATPATEAPVAPAVPAEGTTPALPAATLPAAVQPDAPDPLPSQAALSGEPAPVTDAAPPAPEEVLLQPSPAPQADPAPASIVPDALPSATALPPTAPRPGSSPDIAPAVSAPPEAAPQAEALPEILPAPSEPEPAPKPALVLEPVPPIVADTQPSTLAPDPGLPQADGVKVGLLPRIGAGDPADGVTAPETEALPPTDLPPVQRYARSFENPTAKPAFGILLRDTGEANLDRQALADLSFPVSFVIDPLAPGAAAAAAIYRAAGQEVLMLASGIPEGATPSDLEQTFQSLGSAMPEAVAVIDLATGGFQANRPLATQVIPILAAQGRGLVTFDTGLNAADQEARRAGLPSATIFRRLDAEAESTATIRRYLDRAAFKAAQEGRVLVIGDTRPETIAALLEWAVEGRAASVTLAPVTAILSTP